MAAAQLLLNSFPFICCLFIIFFGRMFSHVLRATMVFLVITCPLLGYILLGGSYSSGLLSGDQGSLNITATYMVAVVWGLWASLSGTYVCIKRASLGKKVESVGIAFLVTMMASSYYMGHVHKEVIKERPGVVSYMEWLTFLVVIVISGAIHIVRRIPGMVDVSESLIHAFFGAFVGLQFFASMGFAATEGLEWQRIITHEFGCQTSACIWTMSFFVFLACVGAIVQVTIFKAGKKDDPFSGCIKVVADMLISLKNINSVVQSYSFEAEAKSDRESLHKLRMTFSEDVYKTIGGVSDVLLLTFTLGLDAACVEMIYVDAYTTFGEDAFSYGVWLMLFAFLATGIAGFTSYIRIDTSPVLSDPWKKQRRLLLLAVCMVWPFMIGSALFSMTVGGEEIATVDVPIINQRFGFHLLPVGCDSLREPPPAVDETETAAWKLENAQAISLANSSWWDGEECHDGLLNNDEESVDCGGSCRKKCFDCECHWSRVGARQVQLGTGFPSAVLVPRYNDTFQGNATAYGDDSYCWNGARDTNGNAVRYCYTTGGANCTLANRPDVIDSTHEGFEWLDPRDTVRPCTRLEIAEVDSGILAPTPRQVDCPAPTPPPPPPRRLWYCSAISSEEVSRCYDCETDGVDWDTPVCGFETGVTCNNVKWLGGELAAIVKLVWGVTITAMISALSGSGSLGGTYLLVNKLTTYLTSLNLIQGFFITLVARVLSSSTGDALADVESAATGFAQMGQQMTQAEDLQSQLQAMSLWNMLTGMGVFMVLQSLLGLVGLCRANTAHGGILLRVYLVTLLVSLTMSCGLFGVAVYFALNIDEIADDYWEVLIAPNLQLTNTSLIRHDFSDMQKHEFVELARGSFRCLILIGCWIAAIIMATGIGTNYTVSNRKSDEAERARQRKAGAVSNPMWTAQADDMNSPLTGAVTGAEALVAGAVVGAAVGAVGAAAGAVSGSVGVADAMADMVVVGSDEDSSEED